MGFHRIQQFRYVVRIVKGLRGGLVGYVNDGAKDEFVLQDIEVMLKIGSGSGKGVYFCQARASAHGFQLVHVFQSLGDGNDVNGFVFVIAGLEKAPEQLVRGEVEVVLRHADGHALPHVSGRVHGHEGQHSFSGPGACGMSLRSRDGVLRGALVSSSGGTAVVVVVVSMVRRLDGWHPAGKDSTTEGAGQ